MTAWDLIGFALTALLTGALFVVYRLLARHIKTVTSLLAICEQRQTLQEQSIAGLTAGSAGVDRRLSRLEATEAILSERQDALESQHVDERPYQQAIRLVHQGASAERLVEELELSESEAELIVRLHGSMPAVPIAEH